MVKKLLIAVVALVMLGLVAHRIMAAPAAHGGMPMGPMPVTVAAVVSRDVQEYHEFSGRLDAAESAEVRSRVEGTIDAVHFTDGAVVKKGDLLFTIDPRPYEAALHSAEAALRSAEAQNAYAKADYERAIPLLRQKVITQRDYDTRANAARMAAAALSEAEAALRAAQLNLGYTQITAPIDGRTGRVEITAGNFVQTMPGAPVLTTIVASRPVYADFDMDEATYLDYVHAGLTLNDKASQIKVEIGLTGEAGTPHRGAVKTFDNQVNGASGSVRVRAQLDNADGTLVPGMFARVRIGAPSHGPSLLVADRAIGTDQDRKVVMVVGADNIVMPHAVQLGGVVDGMRIIRSGLKAGDKIVVNGVQRAIPGMPVMPAEITMDEARDGKSGMPPMPATAAGKP